MDSRNPLRHPETIASDGNVIGRLQELAVVASQAGLRAVWDGGEREMEVRRKVRAICDVAWAGGARIEQILVVLKESWHQLPDNRRRMDPAVQATLARMVTICIHEFYGPRERS